MRGGVGYVAVTSKRRVSKEIRRPTSTPCEILDQIWGHQYLGPILAIEVKVTSSTPGLNSEEVPPFPPARARERRGFHT